MKRLYIPKGVEVSYAALTVDELAVDGTLHVQGLLRAGNISGKGGVIAEEIEAEEICVGSVRANKAVATRIILKTGSFGNCIASESIVSSVYLEADLLSTRRLATTRSSISMQDAEEAIVLKQQPRSMLGTLIRSALRRFWLAFTRPADTPETPKAQIEAAATEAESNDNGHDPQREALLTAYDLLKGTGLRLEVMPAVDTWMPNDNEDIAA